jgi:hypothetical protein
MNLEVAVPIRRFIQLNNLLYLEAPVLRLPYPRLNALTYITTNTNNKLT